MPDEPDSTTWDCEAYGPEGKEFGALCFFAGDNKRTCSTEAVCRDRLAAERQRVFRTIQEHAAAGDATAAFLADEITSPEQILGGGETDGEARP